MGGFGAADLAARAGSGPPADRRRGARGPRRARPLAPPVSERSGWARKNRPLAGRIRIAASARARFGSVRPPPPGAPPTGFPAAAASRRRSAAVRARSRRSSRASAAAAAARPASCGGAPPPPGPRPASRRVAAARGRGPGFACRRAAAGGPGSGLTRGCCRIRAWVHALARAGVRAEGALRASARARAAAGCPNRAGRKGWWEGGRAGANQCRTDPRNRAQSEVAEGKPRRPRPQTEERPASSSPVSLLRRVDE
jgi:hypothetical protein